MNFTKALFVMQADKFNEYFIKVRDACDNYEVTVFAILSFIELILGNKSTNTESYFGIGRNMITSNKNTVRKEVTITPDIVVQKNNQYGIVTEVKSTISKDENFWGQHITQLKKYDDTLTGWWTDSKMINHSDTVLLIHINRSRAFRLYLEKMLNDETNLIGNTTSIVEFFRNDRRDSSIFLRKEWGSINDPILDNHLIDGESITLPFLLDKYPLLKYYDSEPPIVWLLIELWSDYFLPESYKVEYDNKNKCYPIDINLTSLTHEMQKAYGSQALDSDQNSVEFPKQKWFNKALKILVKMKLAEHKNNDEYVVFYKRFAPQTNLYEKFIRMKFNLDKNEDNIPDKSQVELPLVPE